MGRSDLEERAPRRPGRIAAATWVLGAVLVGGPAPAEPRVSPATAALCAGSTEVVADALAAQGAPETPAARMGEVERAGALYRAVVESLAAKEADLEALADHAFFEALAVWTRRREEGWKRTADGGLTAKARNARAAHEELARFVDWCIDRQDDFAQSFLGG